MGYTTQFMGKFSLNRPLDEVTHQFLQQLAETRRMRRQAPPQYGVEGEFFTTGEGFNNDEGCNDTQILDSNQPPGTQPGLWCQWTPTPDGNYLEWDGNEKFYHYGEWLLYLINRVLAPRGYILNGQVDWRGEEFYDLGTLIVEDNVLKMKEGETFTYFELTPDATINNLLGPPAWTILT